MTHAIGPEQDYEGTFRLVAHDEWRYRPPRPASVDDHCTDPADAAFEPRPRHLEPIAFRSGTVELPVYGNEGRLLFRIEFEVLVDHDEQRLVRGRQTIIPLPDGPEPTAKIIQREAQLATAWKEAVRHLGRTDAALRRAGDHSGVAALATVQRGKRSIDADAERRLVAEIVTNAAAKGRRPSTEDHRRAISDHRGKARVSADVARRRKMEAKRLGLFTPLEDQP